MKGGKSSLSDKNSGGFLKRKAMSKSGESEKPMMGGGDFEPISYEWAFRILGDKYQEPDGAPIVRIAGAIKWNCESNIPRIRTSGAKSRRCMGMVREKDRSKNHVYPSN